MRRVVSASTILRTVLLTTVFANVAKWTVAQPTPLPPKREYVPADAATESAKRPITPLLNIGYTSSGSRQNFEGGALFTARGLVQAVSREPFPNLSLWDPVRGQKLIDATIPPEAEFGIAGPGGAFSPDGTRLLLQTDLDNHWCELRATSTGELIARLEGRISIPSDAFGFPVGDPLTFSDNGDMFAICQSHTVSVRSASSGKQICQVELDRFPESWQFAPDGRYLLASSSAGTWLIDIEAGVSKAFHKDHKLPSRGRAFSADSRTYCLLHEGVAIYRAEGGKISQISIFANSDPSMTHISLSSNGDELLTSERSSTTRFSLWRVASAERIDGFSDSVQRGQFENDLQARDKFKSAQFCRDGRTVIAVYLREHLHPRLEIVVRLTDRRTGRLETEWVARTTNQAYEVRQIYEHPNSGELSILMDNFECFTWRGGTSQPVKKLELLADLGAPRKLALSSDGTKLAVGRHLLSSENSNPDDKIQAVWDLQSGMLMRTHFFDRSLTFDQVDDYINVPRMMFAPRSNTLLLCNPPYERMSNHHEEFAASLTWHDHPEEGRLGICTGMPVAISPDERLCAITDFRREPVSVRIVSLQHGKELASIVHAEDWEGGGSSMGEIAAMAFSPSGKQLAVASQLGLSIWETENWQRIGHSTHRTSRDHWLDQSRIRVREVRALHFTSERTLRMFGMPWNDGMGRQTLRAVATSKHLDRCSPIGHRRKGAECCSRDIRTVSHTKSERSGVLGTASGSAKCPAARKAA